MRCGPMAACYTLPRTGKLTYAAGACNLHAPALFKPRRETIHRLYFRVSYAGKPLA